MMFEQPLFRFAVVGLLLIAYAGVEHLSRRCAGEPARRRALPPRWLAHAHAALLVAFQVAIEPLGSAWLGGWGNLAGIGLAAVAMAWRWDTRLGSRGLRQPDVASRLLLYAALPLAAGAAEGWLQLTLPGAVLCAWRCAREDRILCRELGEAWRARVRATSRWIPGVW